MSRTTRATAFLLLLAAAAGAARAHDADINCDNCKEWNAPQTPFNIYGNTWYVGTGGLAALLVTSPQGHILLDGALPQSAPQIIAGIRQLGFRIEDLKLILNSHAHWDHAGGIAALQRASGAEVLASASSADVMRRGAIGADDPQYALGHVTRMPVVDKVRVVTDGEVVKLGALALTAHMTPGHTPGSTSWSWQSCEKGSCKSVVYADSLTAVSEDGFRFSGGAGKPDISALFRATIERVGALPCDIVVSTHPSFTDTFDKLAARTPGHNTFVAPGGCRSYAAAAMVRLDERLARERSEAK